MTRAGATSIENGPFVFPSKAAVEFQSDNVDSEALRGGRFNIVGELNVLHVQVTAFELGDGKVESRTRDFCIG